MHRTGRFLLAALAAAFLAASLFAAPPPKPQTYREILATRPAPDLTTLVQRCRPQELDHRITGESFFDLLKLRDTKDPKAVPLLREVLEQHRGSTRIHRYAAAQALHCIGTPEAAALLAKHLLDADYDVRLGLMYIPHWEMADAPASSFIERYHLQPIGKDLGVELEVSRPDGEKNVLLFGVVLKNLTDQPLRVLKPDVFLGRVLHFRDAAGRFAFAHETVCYNLPMPVWVALQPGEPYRYDVRVEVVKPDPRRPHFLGARPDAAAGAKLLLRTADVAFDTREPGKYQVWAMACQRPLTAEQKAAWKLERPWSGRAVSKPVTVEIAAPE